MAGNRVGDQRERVLTRVAVFLNRDDLKRAAAALEEFHADHPDDERTLLKLAEVRKRQGRFGEAVEVYVKAAGLHAKGRFVLRSVAALRSLGKDTEGTDYLAQAAQRFADAQDRDRWVALAEPLAQHRPPDRAGRLELARAHLERAHPMHPLRHLQACLGIVRTDAEVLELLERVIVLPELAPDTRATAYLHLAEAHEAAGKRPAALLHAREAGRIAPSLPGVARLQARLEGLERMLAPGTEFLRLEQTPTPA